MSGGLVCVQVDDSHACRPSGHEKASSEMLGQLSEVEHMVTLMLNATNGQAPRIVRDRLCPTAETRRGWRPSEQESSGEVGFINSQKLSFRFCFSAHDRRPSQHSPGDAEAKALYSRMQVQPPSSIFQGL